MSEPPNRQQDDSTEPLSPAPDALRTAAEQWMKGDPDPAMVAELRALLEGQDWSELRQRFAGRLAFGTAGLRAEVGAGPMRMNRAVVAQTTAGLCRYLSARSVDAAARGLCIGYDARLDSRHFAEEAASIAAGAGFRVHLFDRLTPTPLVAFSVQQLGAAAGVIVTASHNPPQYNGLKIYGEDGSQLVPPHDAQVAQAIAQAAPAASLPRLSLGDAIAVGKLVWIGDALEQAYLETIAQLIPAATAPRRVRIAYTALHGVGAQLMQRALRAAGFSDAHGVPEQMEPDGGFPSVPFPNPEEPHAMRRVIALAEAVGADLALAHDPDADRLAVAARDDDGRMVVLTGNEVGVLLCDQRLTDHDPRRGKPLVATTLVTSPQVGAVARAHGARWEQTLTGLKWIAQIARRLEAEGFHLALGCEEALGYAFGNAVRDKDGIAAGLIFADLADRCLARGQTPLRQLLDLQARHGVYLSGQVSIASSTPEADAQLRRRLATLRDRPPARLAGLAVTEFTDLDADPAAGPSWARALPRSNVLVFALEGGQRIAVRPSGTEPKLKIYIDVCEPCGGGEDVAAVRARAEKRLAQLRQSMSAFFDETEPGSTAEP